MNYYMEIAESIKKYIVNRIFFMVTGLTIGEYIRWNKLAFILDIGAYLALVCATKWSCRSRAASRE
jgi:hypothetical protein